MCWVFNFVISFFLSFFYGQKHFWCGRITVFWHGCLKISRTPWVCWDKQTEKEQVMGLFFSESKLHSLYHDCWLQHGLTSNWRAKFHWWMTRWSHATNRFFCHPNLLFTLSVDLFLSLTLFSFMIYDWVTHLHLPFNPWITCHALTSCSFQPEKSTTSAVSLTNVFYLSIINKRAVERVKVNGTHKKTWKIRCNNVARLRREHSQFVLDKLNYRIFWVLSDWITNTFSPSDNGVNIF